MNTSHLNRQPGEKFHNWACRVQGEYIDIQTFSEWRGIHKHFYPNSINMVKQFIQEISSYYENGTLSVVHGTCPAKILMSRTCPGHVPSNVPSKKLSKIMNNKIIKNFKRSYLRQY